MVNFSFSIFNYANATENIRNAVGSIYNLDFNYSEIKKKAATFALEYIPSNSSNSIDSLTNFSLLEKIGNFVNTNINVSGIQERSNEITSKLTSFNPSEILNKASNFSVLPEIKSLSSIVLNKTYSLLTDTVTNCSNSTYTACKPVQVLLELSPRNLMNRAVRSLYSLVTSRETYETLGRGSLFCLETVKHTLEDATQDISNDLLPISKTQAAATLLVLAGSTYLIYKGFQSKTNAQSTTPPIQPEHPIAENNQLESSETKKENHDYSPLLLGTLAGTCFASFSDHSYLALIAGAVTGFGMGKLHKELLSRVESISNKVNKTIPAITQTIPNLYKTAPLIISGIALCWINNTVKDLTGLPLKERIVLTTVVAGGSFLAANLTKKAASTILADSYESIERIALTTISLGEGALLYQFIKSTQQTPLSQAIPVMAFAAYTTASLWSRLTQK